MAAAKVEPRCGVHVIYTRTGDIVSWRRLEGVVSELCDVIAPASILIGVAGLITASAADRLPANQTTSTPLHLAPAVGRAREYTHEHPSIL